MTSYLLTAYFAHYIITGQTGITSIINSTKNTINTVKNIFSKKVHNVNSNIETIDLEYKLKIYTSLLSNVVNKKNNNSHINAGLTELQHIIDRINVDLYEIDEKIDNHKNKWMSSWRSLKCKKELKKLKSHVNIMDSRFKTLANLFKIDDIYSQQKNV